MILQVISTVALCTLAVITIYLGLPKNVHVFIAVGQVVFQWISVVLACILASRLLQQLNAFDNEQSRMLNSIIFSVAVLGIIWSVSRHAKYG